MTDHPPDVARLPRESRSRPRAPRGWWQTQAAHAQAQAATRQLIRELGWSTLSPAEIAQRLTYHTFAAHGLGRMLAAVYGSSPYAALRDLFPALQPWQMKHTPQRYWQGEQGRAHAQAATRWFIAQLGLTGADPGEIAAQVDKAVFDRLGLRGMLGIVYGDRPYAALSDLYPSLRPWQMGGGAPATYWRGLPGQEHARAATRWLIAQLGLVETAPAEIIVRLDQAAFAQMHLTAMLEQVYGNNPDAAVGDLYPELRS